MKLAATTALLLTLAGTAAAQPGMAPVAPPPAQVDELSENTALALSIGGTVASWVGLVAATQIEGTGDGVAMLGTVSAFGTLLAPTFGHWYARSIVTRGLGARALGAGMLFGGAALAFSECGLFHTEPCERSGLAPVLAIAGAGLYVAGTLDDWAAVPGAVRRYNHRFQNVAIVPVIQHAGGGVLLTGTF